MRASTILVIAGLALAAIGAKELVVAHGAQARAAGDWDDAGEPQHRPLRPGDLVARVAIPRIGMDVFVFEGTRPEDLARGPGRLSATSRPGANGNCVIAGHRDTHFRGLREVRAGDIVEVRASGAVFRYRVSATHIVDPEENSFLRATRGAKLTLVTCYPFRFVGRAPQRFVVEADLVRGAGDGPAASGTEGSQTLRQSMT